MEDNYFIKHITLNKLEYSNYFSEIDGLKKIESFSIKKPVIFFTGENGTGKSTLLEAIAVNCGFNPEGGSKNFNFSTKETHSDLYRHLTLSKGIRRATDGFFLRAESFYNLATYLDDLTIDFSEYGNKSLHNQSHGESFLNLIKNRFRGNGLYLLDEPEAALSIQNQLSLMICIYNLVKTGSQFIIVTHSPILLAMPNSQIISFDLDSPLEITYEDSKPYELMSLFSNNRDSLFSKMFQDD